MSAHGSRRRAIRIAAIAVAAVVIALVLVAVRRDGRPQGTLADAVRAGDAQLVKAHLEANSDPDEPRILGLTPLISAVIRNDTAIVTLLLQAGADLDASAPEGITAVHAAAQTDAVASLDLLVAAGADPATFSHNGMNALHHAADLNSVGVIAYLADRGMDLDAQSDVVTQGHGHPRDRGSTALAIAARSGHLDAVETLLSLGASVDALSAADHSPLLMAVFSGASEEVVAALLAAGADPRREASCEVGGCTGEAGDALVWARRLQQHALIPLLEEATSN